MGSEMCIRDSLDEGAMWPTAFALKELTAAEEARISELVKKAVSCCLLYTSDAADERSSVDLGGRRIIKKKTSKELHGDDI